MWFTVSASADNDRGPLYMEQALAAIHQANPQRLPLRLMLVRLADRVTLAVSCPADLFRIVENQLYAHYPDCRLERLSESAVGADHVQWTANLHLDGELFPIRCYREFEDRLQRVAADPLSAVLSAVGGSRSEPLRAAIYIDVRPAPLERIECAKKTVDRLADQGFGRHSKIRRFCAA